MAFFKAVSEGERNFKAISIVGDMVLLGGELASQVRPPKILRRFFQAVTGLKIFKLSKFVTHSFELWTKIPEMQKYFHKC